MRRRGRRPRYPRARHALSAAEIVDAVLERHHINRDVRQHSIVTEWAAIVGPRIARRAWPHALRGRVLEVRVTNASWMHELSFLRDDLIERLNAVVGDPPLIDDVRFQLRSRAAGPDDLPEAPRLRARLHQPPAPEPARGERLREIEHEAASVDDPELRAAIVAARRRMNR
jgi:hypothetical protein